MVFIAQIRRAGRRWGCDRSGVCGGPPPVSPWFRRRAPRHPPGTEQHDDSSCAAICSSGLASRQVAWEGVFVEQDLDEVDRAGQVGVCEQGVERGLGFDAVMTDSERLREQAEIGVKKDTDKETNTKEKEQEQADERE